MNGILLTSPDELSGAFQTALRGASHVDIAVAWAMRCHQLTSVCEYAKRGGKLRAVVGRAFPTDPFAIERLLGASPGNIRWGSPPCAGIFHPKVFVFHHKDQSIAIVGSANLTRPAFLFNVEAAVRLSGAAAALNEVAEFFERQWRSAEEINNENLERYKEHWRVQRDNLHEAAQGGLQPPPIGPIVVAATTPILSWTWDQYVQQLACVDQLWQPFGHHRIDSYLAMLAELPHLARQPLAKLSRLQRLALIGIGSEEYPDAGWLGWMGAKGLARQALSGEDPVARETQAAVTAALKIVSPGPAFPPLDVVGEAYHALRQIKNVGPGIATRYLTLCRPDAFVSVNSAAKGLSQVLGIPFGRLSSWEGYEEGLKRLWKAPWMRAPKPTRSLEGTLWDNRSALLDAFVYRPKSGEHPAVTWQ
ncbi:MAG TPA: phospholipase D-like domain-containing protein [Pirellulales bacterium]|nr:phospholipase D-like domain-containing protein [Pirellulales bacterium]